MCRKSNLNLLVILCKMHYVITKVYFQVLVNHQQKQLIPKTKENQNKKVHSYLKMFNKVMKQKAKKLWC